MMSLGSYIVSDALILLLKFVSIEQASSATRLGDF